MTITWTPFFFNCQHNQNQKVSRFHIILRYHTSYTCGYLPRIGDRDHYFTPVGWNGRTTNCDM